MSTLCDIYVIDKTDGRIHRVGDDHHDGIWVDGHEVNYHNLQNGDGGSVKNDKDCGYCILRSEWGRLENEFGIIDTRFEKEIRAYLDSVRGEK